VEWITLRHAVLTMKMPYDFASHRARQKDFAYYTQRFLLDPRLILRCALPAQLTWHRVPFTKSTLNLVANQPGVYAFAIGRDTRHLPPHGYVLYIGQTGAKKNDRTLRQRAKEYYVEKTTGTRPHISEFLNKWNRCLFFHFAPLDPNVVDLLKIEAILNDALVPPYSIKDFSADIRKQKAIWGLS